MRVRLRPATGEVARGDVPPAAPMTPSLIDALALAIRQAVARDRREAAERRAA